MNDLVPWQRLRADQGNKEHHRKLIVVVVFRLLLPKGFCFIGGSGRGTANTRFVVRKVHGQGQTKKIQCNSRGRSLSFEETTTDRHSNKQHRCRQIPADGEICHQIQQQVREKFLRSFAQTADRAPIDRSQEIYEHRKLSR